MAEEVIFTSAVYDVHADNYEEFDQEIDPAKLASGLSMSAEEALHFGLIPRMHRGIFAMNELPELDELVQVGLFNILEERDVQIRGYPIRFDIDVLILFSANPATYNRSGKVIPQLKDRIGSIIQTHYPTERDQGIEILHDRDIGTGNKGFLASTGQDHGCAIVVLCQSSKALLQLLQRCEPLETG